MTSEEEVVRDYSQMLSKHIETALLEVAEDGGGRVYVETLTHAVEVKDGAHVMRLPRLWKVFDGEQPPADLPERYVVYDYTGGDPVVVERERKMTPAGYDLMLTRLGPAALLREVRVLRRALHIMSEDVNPIIIENRGLWEQDEQGIVDHYVCQARTEKQDDGGK